MKQEYRKPVAETQRGSLHQQVLTTSNIPVGGNGGFDVKSQNEWDSLWDVEPDEEPE